MCNISECFLSVLVINTGLGFNDKVSFPKFKINGYGYYIRMGVVLDVFLGQRTLFGCVSLWELFLY